MPQGYHGWAQKEDLLSTHDFIRIIQAATEVGFRKFRLTGGEPLLRRDIIELANGIWSLPGTQTLGISTNGILLNQKAKALQQAGVCNLNISLDTLHPDTYRKLTGGSLSDVLEGIEAACEAGFEKIKLNTVLMRGITESTLESLLDFSRQRNIPIRFIELMPLSKERSLQSLDFFSLEDLTKILLQKYRLEPAQEVRLGHGPARYFRLNPDGPIIGMIGSLTNLDFCAACNKLRLTSDGKLRACLGQHGEMDLHPILRRGKPQDLVAAFTEIIRQKPEDHDFRNAYQPHRPMIAIGG
jgi:cyclic pyranopterin phosphate synthase